MQFQIDKFVRQLGLVDRYDCAVFPFDCSRSARPPTRNILIISIISVSFVEQLG
jgi:hypothetical protein